MESYLKVPDEENVWSLLRDLDTTCILKSIFSAIVAVCDNTILNLRRTRLLGGGEVDLRIPFVLFWAFVTQPLDG